MTEKACKRCALVKPLSEMTRRKKDDKTYYTNLCKKCESLRTQDWQRNNPEKYLVLQESTKVLHRNIRLHQRERAILFNSRQQDRRSGLSNDLDKDFILETIQKGCFYCGESEIKMTLDRIDNTKGHTKDNVLPACSRCNYIRKEMPFDAWLVVAPGMRRAREQGLFGDFGENIYTGLKQPQNPLRCQVALVRQIQEVHV